MAEDVISIAGRKIGSGSPCFIIAEVGINHGGDEAICARMIEAAAVAGADAVKLQTVTPEESYHPDTDSYGAFKGTTLTREAYRRLMTLSEKLGIILFSTPGDPTALKVLLDLRMPAIKISSGLLTNLPLIEMSAAGGVPLILSTGMARLEEVREAVDVAKRAGCRELALLQCTSLYPAPADTLNLNAMDDLRAICGCPVGYSDHYPGDLATIASVARGAQLVEKHFTLDATLPGADHAISIEPGPFGAMVRAIRDIEAMLGNANKAPVAAEEPLRQGRHRRLVAARDLAAGTAITDADIFLMRLPGERSAMPARDMGKTLGRKTRQPIKRLTGITTDMLEP